MRSLFKNTNSDQNPGGKRSLTDILHKGVDYVTYGFAYGNGVLDVARANFTPDAEVNLFDPYVLIPTVPLLFLEKLMDAGVSRGSKFESRKVVEKGKNIAMKVLPGMVTTAQIGAVVVYGAAALHHNAAFGSLILNHVDPVLLSYAPDLAQHYFDLVTHFNDSSGPGLIAFTNLYAAAGNIIYRRKSQPKKGSDQQVRSTPSDSKPEQPDMITDPELLEVPDPGLSDQINEGLDNPRS